MPTREVHSTAGRDRFARPRLAVSRSLPCRLLHAPPVGRTHGTRTRISGRRTNRRTPGQPGTRPCLPRRGLVSGFARSAPRWPGRERTALVPPFGAGGRADAYLVDAGEATARIRGRHRGHGRAVTGGRRVVPAPLPTDRFQTLPRRALPPERPLPSR